ncbi:DME family drug/metabolite transporter [Rhodoglobus vestalii]|uniref:DME family drug/metabolite transporter n=1 Tax=Rhodoglobus vestalii TaxID=193384 RepID=A0A8H2K847_9MICO|nr:DMT family transporter [Rhodoglobus vestalii]TQO20654.1 DME family drug/metabolite transporter [Rhodoglobus vestalii]
MRQSNRYRGGVLLILAASILWGTTGTAATFAPEVSPIAIGAAAMGFGGLLQALIALRSIRVNCHSLREQWRILALGAIAVTVYPLAFYSSMSLAGVAVGTVVSIGSAPVFASIIERVADQYRFTRRWAAGAVLGIGGATVLSISEFVTPAATGDFDAQLGIGLGLLAGFTYALYSWAAHRVISAGVPTRPAMGSIFGVAGVLLMPIVLASGAPLLASWSNASVGIYMAVVPMFAGYVLFGMGLARVRASTAIILSLVEPIVAALLAVVIVGEQLPTLGWVGVGLIASSLMVLTIQSPLRDGRIIGSNRNDDLQIKDLLGGP